ncbi:DUF4254 domain-containing protein [Nocardia sp. NPDC050175]|uniref:DUF4254 domain-containing protein n=1 Tax=Nocardia sp. NPDC050175 TaxID=3364317 RepID=UPI0037AD466D
MGMHRPMDSRTRLPGKDAVLAACRGFPPIEDVVLLEAAGELTALHQTREHTPLCALEEANWHRARLMCDIDEWVTLVTPIPFPSARVHTHTMGQVIDRLAQATVQTYIALAAAPDALFYEASVQLAELGDAYQDLADELKQETRRLPGITIP